MGRAGRRGIDTVGHGVILKESDVDVRDIYDAAISGEFAVDSKFAPTYTMVLSLLRTRVGRSGRGAARQLLRPVPDDRSAADALGPPPGQPRGASSPTCGCAASSTPACRARSAR